MNIEKPFYHWTAARFTDLQANEQGIHFTQDKSVLEQLVANRGSDNLFRGEVHICWLAKNAQAAFFDIDPGYWDSKTIAKLLLAKINHKRMYGNTSGVDDQGNNWKEDNNVADKISMKGLTAADETFLQWLSIHPATRQTLLQLKSFFIRKGYNMLEYANYGESPEGLPSQMLFDRSLIIKEDVLSVEEFFKQAANTTPYTIEDALRDLK